MTLYSYNQLKAIYGDKDKQVIEVKEYLLCLNGSNGIIDAHNASLEAFKRK